MVFNLYYQNINSLDYLSKEQYFRDPQPGLFLAVVWKFLSLGPRKLHREQFKPVACNNCLYLSIYPGEGVQWDDGQLWWTVLWVPASLQEWHLYRRQEPPWDDYSAVSWGPRIGMISEFFGSSWAWGCGVLKALNVLLFGMAMPPGLSQAYSLCTTSTLVSWFSAWQGVPAQHQRRWILTFRGQGGLTNTLMFNI